MITVDFETEAIEGNPIVNPPKPVGVAVLVDGLEPAYLPINSGTINYLDRVWNSGEGLLFHNSDFDLRVAETHLGLAPPPPHLVHDTMPILFLKDPYAKSLGLKPSADRYLDLPPDEQDELKDWILRNVEGATQRTWGAYISKAPFELVKPYAIGDVVRTRQLFEKLYDTVPAAPYALERRIAPLLRAGTVRGVRVNRGLLEQHLYTYTAALQTVNQRICEYVGNPNLNIDSNVQLANALDPFVSHWRLTPKGARSVSKGNLKDTIADKTLLNMLLYRGELMTCLSTFLEPWYAQSEGDGRIHAEWNSVRSFEKGKNSSGTRTGRLSSSRPNLQNVPTEFHTVAPEGLPPLPVARQYLLPEEGHVWVKRDFSSQEVRILAHFEEGDLAEAYRRDPGLDPHETAKQLIREKTGVEYERRDVKITSFSVIYGAGVASLSQQLHRPRDEAYNIKRAYLNTFPGVKQLQEETTRRGRMGQPIHTWGGRKYYAEAPDFAYKLLNYLIQGSAADQTKRCLCDWEDVRGSDDIFLATVHDEINISAPIGSAAAAMKRLRDVMDQDLFDVPMRSEGFVGETWADIEKVPE